MRYRLTCLTPLLAGDGYRLSPIDYMVWKDQVNVLDQSRIFRLLAKGPRLESYLTQLRKADKLDFASWGGFAQNFADRRIPFEHPSAATYWERAQGDSLRIPTFVSGPRGPYLPGSVLKGAVRTGMLYTRWSDGGPKNLESFQAERLPRHPALPAEEQAIGGPATSYMRAIDVADSEPIARTTLKIYLLRVATLQPRGKGEYQAGWKQAPRATVNRAEDGTPVFAEMAAPGTAFEGHWRENDYLNNPEILRMLRWRQPVTTAAILDAANQWAAAYLSTQRQYAEWAGLPRLKQGIEQLQAHLDRAQASGGRSCLVCAGWGNGLLAKSGWLDTASERYRDTLKRVQLYTRAVESGLPFPKTRKIVFMDNEPAALPGWALLEVDAQ